MTTTSTGADPVIRVTELRKHYGETHAVDGLRQVMVEGSPFAPLWVCFAFLAVWLVVCFGIAARFFKWQ